MSLNGLDDTKVVEAYEAAAAEPGGWFLLKYESRDEIQVHSRGNGGIVEVRNAVAAYDETSPLYGFLRYRRRSIIIKYLPEDCSRIIQARVAVHFNAVCERFSPYDTKFEIATATELSDTKLSAACSLHTATCSTSSSTSSLRRRRLMEIAEEEEDDQRAPKRQSIQDADSSRPETPTDKSTIADPVTLNSELASSPEHSKFSAATTSDVPQFVGADERPTSPEADTYSIRSYSHGKPRVKLGPRPSVDSITRPQTAGNFRPISAIPAGVKLFGKGGKKSKSKESNSLSSPQEEIAGFNFGAPSIEPSEDAQGRPTTSSGASIDSVSLPSSPQKKPTMSREKARLMKAMQLRKQKKMIAMQASADAKVADTEEPPALNEDTTAEVQEPVSDCQPESEKDNSDSISKEDSGVVLDTLTPAMPADQTSDLTPSDSLPPSPLVGSSEADQSTTASSISESTDETVRAKDEDHPPDNEATEADSVAGDDSEAKAVTTDSQNANTLQEANATTTVEAQNAQTLSGEVKKELDTVAPDTMPNPEDPIVMENAQTSPECTETSEKVVFPDPELHVNASSSTDTTPSDQNSSTLTPSDVSKDSDPPSAYAQGSAQISTSHAIPVTEESSTSTIPEISHPVDDSPVLDSERSALSAEERQSRRKALVEPIQTTNLDQDEVSMSQEQKLTDELLSAKTEEATPLTATRTPVTPSFPSSPAKRPGTSHSVRTVSNPVRGNLITPVDVSQSSARSMSSGAAYLHHITQQQQSGNLAKKSNNMGSSISQRIKALEKLSAGSGDATTVPSARERPSSTFYAVKKREPSKQPSVLDRASSFRKQTPPTPDQPQESSTEAAKGIRLERSGSVSSRLSIFESPPRSRNLPVPNSNANAPRGRPESVSVTARIIRDPNQAAPANFEPPRDPSDYVPLELKQSPLLVDHQTGGRESVTPAAEQPKPQDRAAETQEHGKPAKSHQSSLSIVKGFIKERRRSTASDIGHNSYTPPQPEPIHGGSAFSPRLSISSRSSFSKDPESILSPAAPESGSGDDAKSVNGDKKLSRASRFMRRLSNLSGSRSKNNVSAISTSVTKEEVHEPPISRPSTTGTPSIVSYMGDVNVQFPDNLLWKRRNMSLDSQGFLILSALPAHYCRPAQGTKRYHLSEFHTPCIPDVEVQELPNSVVLDFIEGSGIQVACEDRAGQLRVLQILQEAHATRGTTYGL